MEHTEPVSENAQPAVAANAHVVYPPKYLPAANNTNIWIKSIISLALYLVLGYFIFPDVKILILITIVVLIHELGHFLAMKYFGYKDLGMFFILLLGAYVSGTKKEISQRESAIILLAGPLPGIIIGLLLQIPIGHQPHAVFAGVPLQYISLLFVFLNIINLLPIYPLDGGQLLNRVFLNENETISRIFILISIVVICWFVWKHNFPFLLIFPVMMVARMFGEKQQNRLEQKVECSGINTNIDYEELPDKDYWEIRKIVIEEIQLFKDITPGPPFEYSHKEEKIMNVIQNLMHRYLIQDVSVLGKLLIFIIWVLAAASPWLFKMNLSFFNQFLR